MSVELAAVQGSDAGAGGNAFPAARTAKGHWVWVVEQMAFTGTNARPGSVPLTKSFG